MVKNNIGVVLIQRNGAKIFFKFYFGFVTHQIETLEKNVLMEKHLFGVSLKCTGRCGRPGRRVGVVGVVNAVSVVGVVSVVDVVGVGARLAWLTGLVEKKYLFIVETGCICNVNSYTNHSVLRSWLVWLYCRL